MNGTIIKSVIYTASFISGFAGCMYIRQNGPPTLFKYKLDCKVDYNNKEIDLLDYCDMAIEKLKEIEKLTK